MPTACRAGDDASGGRVRARDFRQSALLTEVMAQQRRHDRLRDASGVTVRWRCCRPAPVTSRAMRSCGAMSRSHRRARRACRRRNSSAALTQAVAEFGIASTALHALRVCAPVEVAPLSRLRRVTAQPATRSGSAMPRRRLHPVAGQGLNLGLRDAFELACEPGGQRVRATAHSRQRRCLRASQARRRLDRGITTGITDLLASAFTWPLARPLQSALLTAMDLLPPVRRPLASTLLFGRR